MFQGDIELLQFADKPDAAYDMCVTIAPDCPSKPGLQYIASPVQLPEPDIKPILYTEQVENTQHSRLDTLTDEDLQRRYGILSRNRFFNRNESDSDLYPQVLTTGAPSLVDSNIYNLANQFGPSTDYGKNQQHYCCHFLFYFGILIAIRRTCLTSTLLRNVITLIRTKKKGELNSEK